MNNLDIKNKKKNFDNSYHKYLFLNINSRLQLINSFSITKLIYNFFLKLNFRKFEYKTYLIYSLNK